MERKQFLSLELGQILLVYNQASSDYWPINIFTRLDVNVNEYLLLQIKRFQLLTERGTLIIPSKIITDEQKRHLAVPGPTLQKSVNGW